MSPPKFWKFKKDKSKSKHKSKNKCNDASTQASTSNDLNGSVTETQNCSVKTQSKLNTACNYLALFASRSDKAHHIMGNAQNKDAKNGDGDRVSNVSNQSYLSSKSNLSDQVELPDSVQSVNQIRDNNKEININNSKQVKSQLEHVKHCEKINVNDCNNNGDKQKKTNEINEINKQDALIIEDIIKNNRKTQLRTSKNTDESGGASSNKNANLPNKSYSHVAIDKVNLENSLDSNKCGSHVLENELTQQIQAKGLGQCGETFERKNVDKNCDSARVNGDIRGENSVRYATSGSDDKSELAMPPTTQIHMTKDKLKKASESFYNKNTNKNNQQNEMQKIKGHIQENTIQTTSKQTANVVSKGENGLTTNDKSNSTNLKTIDEPNTVGESVNQVDKKNNAAQNSKQEFERSDQKKIDKQTTDDEKVPKSQAPKTQVKHITNIKDIKKVVETPKEKFINVQKVEQVSEAKIINKTIDVKPAINQSSSKLNGKINDLNEKQPEHDVRKDIKEESSQPREASANGKTEANASNMEETTKQSKINDNANKPPTNNTIIPSQKPNSAAKVKKSPPVRPKRSVKCVKFDDNIGIDKERDEIDDSKNQQNKATMENTANEKDKQHSAQTTSEQIKAQKPMMTKGVLKITNNNNLHVEKSAIEKEAILGQSKPQMNEQSNNQERILNKKNELQPVKKLETDSLLEKEQQKLKTAVEIETKANSKPESKIPTSPEMTKKNDKVVNSHQIETNENVNSARQEVKITGNTQKRPPISPKLSKKLVLKNEPNPVVVDTQKQDETQATKNKNICSQINNAPVESPVKETKQSPKLTKKLSNGKNTDEKNDNIQSKTLEEKLGTDNISKLPLPSPKLTGKNSEIIQQKEMPKTEATFEPLPKDATGNVTKNMSNGVTKINDVIKTNNVDSVANKQNAKKSDTVRTHAKSFSGGDVPRVCSIAIPLPPAIVKSDKIPIASVIEKGSLLVEKSLAPHAPNGLNRLNALKCVEINDSNLEDIVKKKLVSQEAEFQSQMSEINKQLQGRENEVMSLRKEIDALQRSLSGKQLTMERLENELSSSKKQYQTTLQTSKQLEEEIALVKGNNTELAAELSTKRDELASLQVEHLRTVENLQEIIAHLKTTVSSLEEQMRTLQHEKNILIDQIQFLEQEKERNKKILQDTIEQAAKEKKEMQEKMAHDFEKLRTVSIGKEQQLLDDFEWKLREVEQTCKRKLEEKDRRVSEQMKETMSQIEEKSRVAEEQLREVVHLKSYEAEVNQLRGLTNDQQFSLRTMSERNEQLVLSEDNLKEEIRCLNEQLQMEKEKLMLLVKQHKENISEKDRLMHTQLELQKNEVAAQWEVRLHQECDRLKNELEQLYSEQQHLAVESLRSRMTQDMADQMKKWQETLESHLKEISTLKATLTEKETFYHKEMNRIQSTADRDILELRRNLDKTDLSYQNKIEKLTEKYEREIEKINEETEKRIKDLENNWQMQLTSTRTTLELVKEQMEREAQDKLQSLDQHHRSQLEHQWEQLVQDKEEALEIIERKYRNNCAKLKEDIEQMQKQFVEKERKQNEIINKIKGQLDCKECQVERLQSNIDTLQGGVQILTREIRNDMKDKTRIRDDLMKKIKNMESSLANEKLRNTKVQNEYQQYKLKSRQCIEHLQNKCECLVKLCEDLKKCRGGPRPEDISLINDLKLIVSEQEKDIAKLTEEKRFYQLELNNSKSNSGNSPSHRISANVRSPSPNFENALSRTPSPPENPFNNTILFPENYFPVRKLEVIWEAKESSPPALMRSKSLELPASQCQDVKLTEEFH